MTTQTAGAGQRFGRAANGGGSDLLLRRMLIADGVLCIVNGLAYVAGFSLLGPILGLSATLLIPAGVFLLAFGVGVAVLGTRKRISRRLVTAVIVVNAVWVVDSLLVAFTGLFAPTVIGVVWLVAQAVVVAVAAELEYVGLRRAGRTA